MDRLKIMSGLAVACAFAVSASAGATKSGTKTLTGCLHKGTEAGTYMLTNVTGGPATGSPFSGIWTFSTGLARSA